MTHFSYENIEKMQTVAFDEDGNNIMVYKETGMILLSACNYRTRPTPTGLGYYREFDANDLPLYYAIHLNSGSIIGKHALPTIHLVKSLLQSLININPHINWLQDRTEIIHNNAENDARNAIIDAWKETLDVISPWRAENIIADTLRSVRRNCDVTEYLEELKLVLDYLGMQRITENKKQKKS